jgi:hypothetical protein
MSKSIVNGGVSAAAALAAASGAYAGIVVVPVPANLPNAASPNSNPSIGGQNWDVDSNGIPDFTFQVRNPQSATQVVWQANMSPVTAAGTNALAGYIGGYGISYAVRLSAGASIGAVAPSGFASLGASSNPAQAGSWRNPAQVVLGSFYGALPYGGFAVAGAANANVRGFVGFRFDQGGQTRYGWLDVEVRRSGTAAGSGGIFFYGAAYEDSGAPIAAGAVPAPGTLAGLAVGAAACLRRKRRVA